MFFVVHILSVAYVGKKSSLARTLDSGCKLALVLCASSGNTAGKNLSALGDELLKSRNVLVIDNFYFIGTESANLLFSANIRTEGTLCIVSIHYSILNLSDSNQILNFHSVCESYSE